MSEPTPILPAFEFLNVNGIIYRADRLTGELWRLQPDPNDRKSMLWSKIPDPISSLPTPNGQ